LRLESSRVLVTGAGGFIGSHLVQRLIDDGASVTAFVRYNSTSSTGFIDSIPDQYSSEIETISGDISEIDDVEKAMQGQDVVFHLAAMVSVPYSYEAPGAFVDTNVIGTLNVLQAARHNDGVRVIHTSSVAALGVEGGRRAATEETPFNQHGRATHYTRSKNESEFV